MSFPIGPFFNFRCRTEFSLFKRIMWVVFGEKKVGCDANYRITAYYFRGVTYIRSMEDLNDLPKP